MSNLEEQYKTCGRCVHDGEGASDIAGSTCYLCRRNPTDNRIDWFEENKESTLKECEYCNGSGVRENKKCPVCYGSGVVCLVSADLTRKMKG